MEIIPAIDLLAGRCVRLYQGDFGQVTRYEFDPLELARSYAAADMKRLHVVDLDGARSGVPANLEIIRRLARESGMAVQTGGGVRSREMLDRLIACGADRVVVGSVAVTDPDTAAAWLAALGPERLVLAFDVSWGAADETPVALTHGWRETSGKALWDLLDYFLRLGARHFLCTDINRDGTLRGPNTALYRECRRRHPEARLQASGGLSGAVDLPALAATGVAGIVTGKALLDGRLTLEEIQQFSRGE